MLVFDTNHLLRHILQDDVLQSAHVSELLQAQVSQGETVRLLDLVLMETCWVAQSVYQFDREAWCEVMEALLSDEAFSFDDANRLINATELYREGTADFDDYLILSHAQVLGAKLETFDKKLKKSL